MLLAKGQKKLGGEDAAATNNAEEEEVAVGAADEQDGELENNEVVIQVAPSNVSSPQQIDITTTPKPPLSHHAGTDREVWEKLP